MENKTCTNCKHAIQSKKSLLNTIVCNITGEIIPVYTAENVCCDKWEEEEKE